LGKKAASEIMLVLLTISIVSLEFNIQPTKARTITVPDDYPTIQEAVNAASSGDTIFVRAGTYYEHVVVNKTVSLTGENRDTTIIDGGGVGNAVDVLANNVTITGFTVRGSGGLTASGFGSGIYLFCSDNAEIRGNNIVSNYCGIYLKQSNNVVISENAILFQSNLGVYLVDSRGIIVKKNNMTNNRVGIYIAGSEDSIVSENNITNNERSGIESVGFRSYNNSFIRNVITGNMIGIVLGTADRNILDGNIVTNNMVGIELRNSEGIILRNNNMTSNRKNFHVGGGWYILEHFIHDIDTSNTVNGKPMYYLVNQHNLTVPTDAGYVAVVNSTLVTMRGLILTSNGEGVLLFNVTKSLIENVTLSDNGFGIIMYNSNNNTIRRNHVINNFKALGIVLSGSNTIYHNNFIDNDGPAWNPELDSNIWDDGYPSGGNYWSDYNGTDLYSGPYQNETGSDGIGDAPYIIDENNVDRYPLMGPFNSFNTSVEYSVNIISNSTIEDFKYFDSNNTIVMYVSNMTANQTVGFCRLTIPHDVMYPPYIVKVNDTIINFQTTYENYTEGISIIYFTYEHSKLEITIIPEYPSMTIMLLLSVTLVTTALTKRKLQRRKCIKELQT